MKHPPQLESRQWPPAGALAWRKRPAHAFWVAFVLTLSLALASGAAMRRDFPVQHGATSTGLLRGAASALQVATGTRDHRPQSALLSTHLTQEGAVFHTTWSEGCETPPPDAEVALDYAAGIWGSLLTSPVAIEVSACWTSSLPCDGLACAEAVTYARNFSGASLVDTFYPIALANAFSGVDLAPASFDINLYFDAGVDWSFATEGSPTGLTDFVSVALHELCHGLGFSGNMYESYNVGFCGNGPFYWYACPTPYDRFAADSQGVPLLSYQEPDPRVLGTLLKSDANFSGPNTLAQNGGNSAKLYTPTIWEQGRSLSHLDPTIFESGENALMTPAIAGLFRSPGPVALAMLQDMGWLRADGAPNLTQSGPLALGVGQSALFEANLAWPAYAAQPITYTWTVAAQAEILHAGRGLTDSVPLSWTLPGLKAITLTATGADAPAGATRSVLVFGVSMEGPAQGDPGVLYTFNAALAPSTTGLPVTYRWEASGQVAVTHPDQDTTDAMDFTWTIPGTQTITVTATIDGAPAQAVHTIQIGGNSFDHSLYLPTVWR